MIFMRIEMENVVIRCTLAVVLAFILCPLCHAQMAVSNPTYIKDSSPLHKFKPQPQKNTRIDYDIWNSLLEEMVLYTGPSSRKRMPRPATIAGSKLTHGHISAYRLEGNRIPFSEMKPRFKEMITEYRQDLEQVGTDIDISKLSRNEQLAFWFNLHNVVMIEQLAKEYPMRRPSDLKIGSPPTSLNEAKIINIKNTKLSLRDIRERIVYPNWRNPKVTYGFYLGDIGSPSIQNTAFNSKNISDVLDRSASEFVNSLRGFHVRNNKQYVSRIYKDIAPFYFSDFNTNLADHLKKFMRDDVRKQMIASNQFQIDRYDPMIADMTAGQGRFRSKATLQSTSEYGITRDGGSPFGQYVSELVDKREALVRRGLVGSGTVIIEDIPTEDSSTVITHEIE